MAIRSRHERIWIVRHGNTLELDETSYRIGVQTDLALVESGRALARAVANFSACEGIVLDRVLSSPLRRTRETAEVIAPAASIEPVD